MTEKTYLDLEEVNSLLPDKYKFDSLNKIERSIFRTKEGKPLPVLNSKLYPQNYFLYNTLTDYYKSIGVEHICFTAGLAGVFVIPIDIVSLHCKYSTIARRKGRQYQLRIKVNENNTFSFWSNDNPKEIFEITQFFFT